MQPGGFEVAGDLASVKLNDLSENPALWEGTLGNLSSLTGRLIEELAPVRELAGEFVRDYNAFLERYREVPRSTPPMPAGLNEAEVRAWHEMVEKDLAKEPRWGDVAQRLFASEARRFASVAAGSK
jgi:hypothetical protein